MQSVSAGQSCCAVVRGGSRRFPCANGKDKSTVLHFYSVWLLYSAADASSSGRGPTGRSASYRGRHRACRRRRPPQQRRVRPRPRRRRRCERGRSDFGRSIRWPVFSDVQRTVSVHQRTPLHVHGCTFNPPIAWRPKSTGREP